MTLLLARSAGSTEYTNYTSAKGKAPPTSVMVMTSSNLMGGFSNAGALGNTECPFIVLSVGQIELFQI